MKFTKRNKQKKHDRKEETWNKFKDQQNKLNANRKGVKSITKQHW